LVTFPAVGKSDKIKVILGSVFRRIWGISAYPPLEGVGGGYQALMHTISVYYINFVKNLTS